MTPSPPFISATAVLRLLALVAVGFMLLPLAGIAGGVLFGAAPESPLSGAALRHYLSHTALYVVGVAATAALIALPAAWLTVMHRFPGDKIFSYLLFLPFAFPPYVTAYALEDLLDAAGVPALNFGAAIVFTALALYPYVYLFARAALRGQSCRVQSAARTMGYSPLAAAVKVSWPLARPAVVVGLALVVMETLNDVAIAEHFGVSSLGIAVYDLWLNRGDVFAACRLAFVMMAVVALVLILEERARRRRRLHQIACDRCFDCDRALVLSPLQSRAARAFLSLPIIFGFVAPLGWLIFLTLKTPPALWQDALGNGVAGSLLLSLSLAAVLLLLATVLILDKRYNGRKKIMSPLVKLSQMGYAMPGAILAQGLFLLSGFFSDFGRGAVLYGGFALLLAACAARFCIVVAGGLEAAMDKISPQLDAVSRLSNRGLVATFFAVHLPLLRPAVATAMLLIFLEGFKELPMTLILRPFGFDTLATVVYQYAGDEALALAAPAALAMAVIGGVAVSLLFAVEGGHLRAGGRP